MKVKHVACVIVKNKLKINLKGTRIVKSFILNEFCKSYYDNKDKILHQQKDYYIQFRELVRIYIELDNRLEALVEKSVNSYSTIQLLSFSKNDTENNQNS